MKQIEEVLSCISKHQRGVISGRTSRQRKDKVVNFISANICKSKFETRSRPDDKGRAGLGEDAALRVDVLLLPAVHHVLLLDHLQGERHVLALHLHLPKDKKNISDDDDDQTFFNPSGKI